jgi:hypothetical protein
LEKISGDLSSFADDVKKDILFRSRLAIIQSDLAFLKNDKGYDNLTSAAMDLEMYRESWADESDEILELSMLYDLRLAGFYGRRGNDEEFFKSLGNADKCIQVLLHEKPFNRTIEDYRNLSSLLRARFFFKIKPEYCKVLAGEVMHNIEEQPGPTTIWSTLRKLQAAALLQDAEAVQLTTKILRGMGVGEIHISNASKTQF